MSNLSEDEINTQLAEFESTFTQCEYNSEQVQNRLDAFREWAALKFQQLQRKSDAETLRSEIETKQQEVNNGFTNNLAELSAQIDQLRLEVQAGMNTPSSAALTLTFKPRRRRRRLQLSPTFSSTQSLTFHPLIHVTDRSPAALLYKKSSIFLLC